MPYSHHSHSGQFCKHAVGNLEQVVLEAITQGFETFGLTEHVPRYRNEDLYPEEADMSLESLSTQFDDFLAEAHRLKTKYVGQITLLIGLETDFITSCDLSGLSNVLDRHSGRIEYLVGSIHHVAGIPIDFDLSTFTKSLESFSASPSANPANALTSSEHYPYADAKKMTSFLCAYFDAQYELMQRFRPEIIGHFDLCRLYTPSLRFSDYPAALERIHRNVCFAVDYGALFELNAAAFRKGWDTAYPGQDVLEIILQAGGRFALSDDSHGPHAVGLNYDRLLQYARHMGVAELWVLERSTSSNAGGRNVVPSKVVGQWDEHPYWQRLRSVSEAATN